MKLSEIHYPGTIAELMVLLAESPEILLLAGGTAVAGVQTGRSLDLPPRVASIARMSELRKIQRTEQFLEIGSCTTLTGLLSLSSGLLPPPLPEVIAHIATPAVRNFATIGGNLCVRGRFMDLWPFLACMEAQLELRSPSGSRWASAIHLADESGQSSILPGSLLIRIRIPFHSYDFIYRTGVGKGGYPSSKTANFVVMANRSNGKIENLRLIYSGERAFLSKELDQTMSGRKTTAGRKEVQSLLSTYTEAFEKSGAGDPAVFVSLIGDAFSRLFA